MKKTIKDVLVVEGAADASYISSLVEALIVTTNGYEIPDKEIDFLNHLPKGKKVLILTDSDKAGGEIRNRLNDRLTNLENILVSTMEGMDKDNQIKIIRMNSI